MNDIRRLPRSPELMSRGDTALLVVDVQEKLLPAIADGQRVIWNVRRLVDGAKILGLPVVATEQYPAGFGSNDSGTGRAARAGAVEAARSVAAAAPSCSRTCAAAASTKFWFAASRPTSASSRRCWTCLADGWRVYVAVDAVGSRFEIDCRTAIGRMDSSGATLTTTEAALFEWCEAAGTAEFKQISQLAKETCPSGQE